MKEPIGGSMGEKIVDKKSPRLPSPIIGGHENQLRTESAAHDVAKVLDVGGWEPAMHLVRTWRSHISHLRPAVVKDGQNGVERPRHGMTPLTD
jgi:hypothetical protein